MFNKLLSLSLTCSLLIAVTPAHVSAQSGPESETEVAAKKVKARIVRLGTGKRARLEVRLKDGRRLKGYVGEIAEEHFSIADAKAGTVTAVPYDQVEKLKKVRNGSLIYALVGGVGTLVIVIAIALASLDES